ncbi:MAG: winged helix-turn-helix domain-containing protein [Gammaproteobacteria bacterium]|nr:winged helix-turn-helix domain-containing protein [Gammaproteobacteria bacterium]
MTRILLVDGNSDDRDWVRDCLHAVGHEVVCASDATTAVDRVEHRPFDLVVTEWMLRDMSGLEFARYVRKHANGRLTRVVILTGQDEASAIAHALDSGIDDYLIKPLREEELMARINAALRRPAASSRETGLQIGPISLDRLSHKVTVGQQAINLAPVEFRLLAYFMENPGRVLPRRHLLDQVWRRRSGIGERTVDVHVRRLRAALEPHACEDLLQTVRGFGYRFG